MSKVLHECPLCQEKQFSSYQKITSASFAPVNCPACKQQSYLPIVHGLMALTAWTILTWVFIGLAIMAGMSFFLLGTIPALIVSIDRYMLKAPLVANTPP